MVSTQCAVSKGDFPLKITWFFDGKPVGLLYGTSVTKANQRISMLSIESVDSTHTGEYTCVAENPAGKDKYFTTLNVNGTYFFV